MVTGAWHKPCSHYSFVFLTQCNSKMKSEWPLFLVYLLLSTCTVSFSLLIITFKPNFHIPSYQYSQKACELFYSEFFWELEKNTAVPFLLQLSLSMGARCLTYQQTTTPKMLLIDFLRNSNFLNTPSSPATIWPSNHFCDYFCDPSVMIC